MSALTDSGTIEGQVGRGSLDFRPAGGLYEVLTTETTHR
jgi:hypothetical protein